MIRLDRGFAKAWADYIKEKGIEDSPTSALHKNLMKGYVVLNNCTANSLWDFMEVLIKNPSPVNDSRKFYARTLCEELLLVAKAEEDRMTRVEPHLAYYWSRFIEAQNPKDEKTKEIASRLHICRVVPCPKVTELLEGFMSSLEGDDGNTQVSRYQAGLLHKTLIEDAKACHEAEENSRL